MVYFIFLLLLSVLFCYTSFLSIYISFLKHGNLDFLTIIFIITITTFSFLLIRQVLQYLKEKSIQEIFKNRKLLGICLIGLLIGFFNIFSQYPSRALHWAEINQFKTYQKEGSIVKTSYQQQQPPLDYYFSFFSNKLWGHNKLAVRFHAMFFYLVLCFILPFGLWFFCHSYWITSIGVLIFSINHTIRLHSLDARPLSLCLLTGFIFLFFYMSCKKDPKLKTSILSLTASQYLFVMSIGLQPIIFILSLFLSSFWDLSHKGSRVRFKKLLISHFITAILSAPFYIKMYLFAQSSHKYKPIIFKNIMSFMENYNIIYFLEKFFFNFYEQLSFSFLLLLIRLVDPHLYYQKKTPQKNY